MIYCHIIIRTPITTELEDGVLDTIDKAITDEQGVDTKEQKISIDTNTSFKQNAIALLPVTNGILDSETPSGNPNQNQTTTTGGGGPKQLESSEPVANTNTNQNNQNRTRHKMHLGKWWAHMGRPSQILKEEFGYNISVDATKDNDWDLIFGGYPHYGEPPIARRPKKWDWTMEGYLNHHLAERGWDRLQPHQVWFPCMGCKDSYCNKRGMCEITRKFDPDSCFLLPDDLEKVTKHMEAAASSSANNNDNNDGDGDVTGTSSLWVLKQDSNTMHKHMGTGVSFIRNVSQLPSREDMADGTWIVQPFVEQWMGTGDYHRRQEIRLYVAITSTSPLRAYAWNEPWVGLAMMVYDPPKGGDGANAAAPDVCMLDTHIHRKGCDEDGLLTRDQRTPSFEEFSRLYNLVGADLDRFQKSVRILLRNILATANPQIRAHPVNDGITKSGASCFSFLRADMTVASNGEAYVYEINEFPFANEKDRVASRVQARAYRDLFQMIGLDRPALPAEERAAFELANLGGWIPLYDASP